MCNGPYLEDMCEECRKVALEFEETEHGERVAIRMQEAVNRRD